MDQLLQLISGLAIVGVPVIVFLPAAIALLKQVGLPTSWTGVAAAVLGMLVALAIQAVKTWPTIEPWVGVVVTGTLLGLASNGLYSQYKHFTDTRSKDAGLPEELPHE